MYNLSLSKEEEELSKNIYNSSIVFEGLGPYAVLDNLKLIQEYIDSGITAINVTVANWPENFYRGIQRVAKYSRFIKEHSDTLILVKNIADIKKAKREKKLGIVFGFQDTIPIEDDLNNLDIYYNMGVRIIQLTYNAQNLVGTGCCELFYNGITYFGRKVIERINELGIAIDLSHCSDPTTMDAIKLSKKPIYITHSSIREICNAYGRNKTKDQIIALAKKGGVIGITFFPCLVKRNNSTYEVLPAKLEDVLNHMEYVINLVDVDHVAFGSDLCETWVEEKSTPATSSLRLWRPLRPDVFGRGPTEFYDPQVEGLERHSEFINLARGLLKRGYKENEIKKILGGNVMRVLNEIW